MMGTDCPYRAALHAEIERLVSGERWRQYTEGRHFRELEFLHLTERRAWTAGAFDLYRPGDPAEVIDFKTHEIGAV